MVREQTEPRHCGARPPAVVRGPSGLGAIGLGSKHGMHLLLKFATSMRLPLVTFSVGVLQSNRTSAPGTFRPVPLPPRIIANTLVCDTRLAYGGIRLS